MPHNTLDTAVSLSAESPGVCVHIYTCIHKYIHTYTHIDTYIHICIYAHVYRHTYIYTYIHTCTHTPAHTHMCHLERERERDCLLSVNLTKKILVTFCGCPPPLRLHPQIVPVSVETKAGRESDTEMLSKENSVPCFFFPSPMRRVCVD